MTHVCYGYICCWSMVHGGESAECRDSATILIEVGTVDLAEAMVDDAVEEPKQLGLDLRT